MVSVSLEIEPNPGHTSRRSFSWLVVGSLHDDRLLAAKHIDLNACPSPFQMTVGLISRPAKGEEVRVVVAVMSATVIGRDCIKPVSMDTADLVLHCPGSFNRHAQCAVAPTANAAPAPSPHSLQGTDHASVMPCQGLVPRDDPIIAMPAKDSTRARNGTATSAVSHNVQCQPTPLPRAVVVIPSIRKVSQPAQCASAPATGTSLQKSQSTRFHSANQSLCSMQCQPLHETSINRSPDVEAAHIHPPGGAVKPSQAQPPSRLEENPNHAIALEDVPEDHTDHEELPLDDVDIQCGEYHSSVPHLLTPSEPNKLDDTCRRAPESKSVKGLSHDDASILRTSGAQVWVFLLSAHSLQPF